jgi:hypothetical protein
VSDGQEQVPQAGRARLLLQVLDDGDGRPALARIGVLLQLLLVRALVRVDVLVHELLQARLEFLGLGGVVEVHVLTLLG